MAINWTKSFPFTVPLFLAYFFVGDEMDPGGPDPDCRQEHRVQGERGDAQGVLYHQERRDHGDLCQGGAGPRELHQRGTMSLFLPVADPHLSTQQP